MTVAKTQSLGPSFVVVHVYRGRKRHLAHPSGLVAMTTLCGKGWVGTIVGSPAADKPLCFDCAAAASERHNEWAAAQIAEQP